MTTNLHKVCSRPLCTVVLNLDWPPAQTGHLLCDLSLAETRYGDLEVLALRGHGPETAREGSCVRGHMQGTEALPGMEESHLALSSPADPPAVCSHMKEPKETSRGTAPRNPDQ